MKSSGLSNAVNRDNNAIGEFISSGKWHVLDSTPWRDKDFAIFAAKQDPMVRILHESESYKDGKPGRGNA